MTDELIKIISQNGPMGAVCALSIVLLILKDRELSKERAARIDDAKRLTEIALQLQSQVISSINKMADLFDELKKVGRS